MKRIFFFLLISLIYALKTDINQANSLFLAPIEFLEDTPLTQVASMTYLQDGNLHQRVYVSRGGQIKEYCVDGETNWYVSEFSATGTKVAVSTWFEDGSQKTSVCYENDGTIKEKFWTG